MHIQQLFAFVLDRIVNMCMQFRSSLVLASCLHLFYEKFHSQSCGHEVFEALASLHVLLQSIYGHDIVAFSCSIFELCINSHVFGICCSLF